MSASIQAPPSQVPLLDLKAQYATLRAEAQEALRRVCESQQFIGGPEVQRLEEEVAAYSGCEHGIGMSSGTDALLCAMMALGIGPGDEVIVPSFTFFATGGCVSRLGARPVFADVCPRTYNLRATDVEAKLSPRTKLIVPVHLFGQVADMDPILALASKRGIPVMEDAAQSIGAARGGRKSGQFGTITTLSFFPSKNLGAFGDAGMILTSDAALAEKCRLLRNHGAQPKYYHALVGGNFRLDALQAAVLRIKLPHLEAWTEARRENARRYDQLFAGSPVGTPWVAPDCRMIFNQYVVRVQRRDALRAHLDSLRIGTEVYYPVPLHMQQCFADLGGKAGDLPNSESAAKEVLALPIYPELPAAWLEYVAETILTFVKQGA